jgi:hypothetical protein
LYWAAWSGLCGANSNLDVGADNLQDVKDYIADQFPMVREKIWRSNRNVLLVVGGICLLASIAYYFVTGSLIPNTSAGTSIWPALQLAMFAIPLGVAFGLFVEFLFRVNDDVPYDQLRTINAGRWRPFQRAFNTLVVAYLLAGILALELLQIGIASVLLNDFVNKKPWLSLVIGFITGFAFPYVRDLIQQVKPEKRSDPMAGR